MPKVSGKKTSKAGKGRTGRGRKAAPPSLSERISGFFSRLVHVAVTYTAVVAVGLFLIVVLMLFAGGYFVNFGGRLVDLTKDMTEAAGLKVTKITWAGATQTADYEVMDALLNDSDGAILNQSIVHFSPARARAKVEGLGWVRDAAVTRLYPNTIHVSISERIPAALWEGEGLLHLIDRDGIVITQVGGHQYTGLPLITDTPDPSRANEILAVLGSHPQLAARIATLRHRGGRRWDLGFRNGFIVMLPEENYAAAIEKIGVLEAEGKLSDTMEKLDLRLPNAIYYVPKNQS